MVSRAGTIFPNMNKRLSAVQESAYAHGSSRLR
jgi:hypothetical protein